MFILIYISLIYILSTLGIGILWTTEGGLFCYLERLKKSKTPADLSETTRPASENEIILLFVSVRYLKWGFGTPVLRRRHFRGIRMKKAYLGRVYKW